MLVQIIVNQMFIIVQTTRNKIDESSEFLSKILKLFVFSPTSCHQLSLNSTADRIKIFFFSIPNNFWQV